MRLDVACDEHYIGSAPDVARIVGILEECRRQPLTPEYMRAHLHRLRGGDAPPTIDTQLLSDFAASRKAKNFDFAFFENTVEHASRRIRETFPAFRPVSRDAYVVGEASGRGLGGFHGQYGVGFQYASNFAFSELLNPSMVPDEKIRAIELARNYLHDSFHASTYRTFGLFDGTIFRYQYGINFRLPSGISYSGTSGATGWRFTINLNTLMDGVTVMVAADAVRDLAYQVSANDDLTGQVIQEILGEYTGIEDPAMAGFADRVVTPTADFVSYWGGESFRDAIGRAMLSGKIAPLKRHLEDTMLSKKADRDLIAFIESRRHDHTFLGRDLWEDLFLSVDFHRSLVGDTSLHPLTHYSGIVLQ